MEVTDAQLLQGILAGDESAFRMLFDRYSLSVLKVLYRLLHEPADAEDVMQETFLQFWHRSHQYDAEKASIPGYLTLIARSRALDLLRKRRPGQADPNHDPGFENDPTLGLVQDESRTRVRQALMKLPQDQRECIRMAFLSGMTHEQIAAMLHVPLGTVKTRIRLGLRRMRGSLPEEGAGA